MDKSPDQDTATGRPVWADPGAPGMRAALEAARLGLQEGGIPIGSALVDGQGQVLASGCNQRVQKGDPILHGEMDCLQKAGRRSAYRDCTIYSTLMPCYMCAGTIVQFKIPRVVVGESRNFDGARQFMESHGVQVIDLDLPDCYTMMADFIKAHPDLWHEDIAE